MRAPASECDREHVRGSGRLADEPLLHLQPRQHGERVDVVALAGVVNHLRRSPAVLLVACEDGGLAPGVLREERLDFLHGHRILVAKRLVGEHVVLVERRDDGCGVVSQDLLARRRACSRSGNEDEPRNAKQPTSTHRRYESYMYANGRQTECSVFVRTAKRIDVGHLPHMGDLLSIAPFRDFDNPRRRNSASLEPCVTGAVQKRASLVAFGRSFFGRTHENEKEQFLGRRRESRRKSRCPCPVRGSAIYGVTSAERH